MDAQARLRVKIALTFIALYLTTHALYAQEWGAASIASAILLFQLIDLYYFTDRSKDDKD